MTSLPSRNMPSNNMPSNTLSKNQHAAETTHVHRVHVLDNDAIQSRLHVAKSHCQQHGVRFTELRERVYRLILQTDKPIGAYELMQQVQDERVLQAKQAGQPAKMVAPPTVYRTLEFLLEQGFIHQLTSKNAYVPCCHPRHAHTAVFLLCHSCETVQEFSDLSVSTLFADISRMAGFAIQDGVMEFQGLCQTCQTSHAS